MSWDERQRAMLAEMGYRLPAAAAAVDAAPGEPVEPAPEPKPVAVAAPPVAVMRPPAPAPSGPSGFAGLDLPALREAIAGCRACGLCEQRRHAVFGNGALQQVQWLVVTDPPDEADDASGEALGGDPPGDAGRLLDRMLLAAGQRRAGRHEGEAPALSAGERKR